MPLKDVPRMISVPQAIEWMEKLGLPRRSSATVIGWVEKYGMGYKVGGGWVVEEDKFVAFLRGEYGKEEGANA